MLRKLFTALCLSTLSLSAIAQEQQDAPRAEQLPPDGATGFSPQALKEWEAIEKELAQYEGKPEKLLTALDDCLTRDLLSETQQLLRAIKAQVINKMLDDIFRTAEKEADILKAKALVIELIDMMPNDEEREFAKVEVELQFADPAAILQQVQQARNEQIAADVAAEQHEQDIVEHTEADYARIAEIRTELDSISGADAKVSHLKSLLNKESRAVCDWIRPQISDILIAELNTIQEAGIKTVDDVLKVKACFVKIIHHTYPEREKKAALEKVELEFANPEALLQKVLEQEKLMNDEDGEEEEQIDEEDTPSYDDDDYAEEVEEESPEGITA